MHFVVFAKWTDIVPFMLFSLMASILSSKLFVGCKECQL